MSDPKRLAQAEITQLSLGYMRLSDAAPLILAQEAGLFSRYGLDVTLKREVSWANLRDKLVVGELDAAQLLAPLPLSTTLGAGGLRGKLLTGLALGLNGNAITLSNRLWDALHLQFPNRAPDPLQVAARLREHLLSTGEALTLATVHPFSMHTFLLQRWLRAGGIDIDQHIRLLVLPPEQMCDSLARGIIDGFCVGEPWSTVAVEQGIGVVASSGYQIWNNAPEKVLGVTEQWHDSHPATHLRLRLAIMEACRLLVDNEQRRTLAPVMSQPHYLGLPEKLILPSLIGQYRFNKHDKPIAMPDFHVFWKYQAGFPWRSHAQALLAMSESLLGKPLSQEEKRALVQQTWRPDLYREAARFLGEASPGSDYKPEGLHDGRWEFEKGIVLGADRQLPQP
ncbi:MAG: ABC transporter substrate-binding protein [Pseudomonadales bacterium]|nr:ABC transporter substrate-binding protein [Pseudomonadales bacterium]MCP5330625.1 ABC transporter substrate-binding protein [Pseudomonadales bacterium]MCP5344252.1 ABC transporter substrate-binding protein [Pseudomonadales bacterium]